MKAVTSAEFQKNFGQFKREALSAPVSVLVHGRPTLVVLSQDQYDALLSGQEIAPEADTSAGDVAELERIAQASSMRFSDQTVD